MTLSFRKNIPFFFLLIDLRNDFVAAGRSKMKKL